MASSSQGRRDGPRWQPWEPVLPLTRRADAQLVPRCTRSWRFPGQTGTVAISQRPTGHRRRPIIQIRGRSFGVRPPLGVGGVGNGDSEVGAPHLGSVGGTARGHCGRSLGGGTRAVFGVLVVAVAVGVVACAAGPKPFMATRPLTGT